MRPLPLAAGAVLAAVAAVLAAVAALADDGGTRVALLVAVGVLVVAAGAILAVGAKGRTTGEGP